MIHAGLFEDDDAVFPRARHAGLGILVKIDSF
jgi:hypothetical protein